MHTIYKGFPKVDFNINFHASVTVFQIMHYKKSGSGGSGELQDCNMKSAMEYIREKR